MFGALKRGFRSMPSLRLVRNVVGELQPKRTLAASRGFFAAARLSCFHVECKHPMTAKMHKIFIAQKSHWSCRVLSLATIRSKYYFDFILIRTRSGQELFDHPSYWLTG